MINYYVILEIPDFSSQVVIKKAYRTLSKKYHPDVNKDPFANSYFLKINEAYDFLMDDNKRLLLHQFLHLQHTSKTTNNNNQQSKYQEDKFNKQEVLEPVIHFFSADKKHFEINDYVLLQWNVSQCKSVSINVFGTVDFAGTHYLKIDHFADEIIVLMTVIGFNNKEYKYQIKLQYSDKNPAKKAYQKVKAQYPNAEAINFKEETFFGMHARINKNVFKNRMILLGLVFLIELVVFFIAPLQTVTFLVLLILSWLAFTQCYKRIHDTKSLKYKVYLLFVPIYNLFVLQRLFILDSETNENEFGIIPLKTSHTLIQWIINGFKKINNQLTLLHKLSIGSFILLICLVTFKAFIPYKETTVKLTSYYTTSTRPTSRGNVNYSYFLVFNDKIPVNVSEIFFDEVIIEKKYDTFKIALKNDNEVEYIKLIDSKNNTTERINLGLLQSNNPLLIIVVLLFLSQLYVWRNLTAPAEIKFANAYMVFVMIIYVYAIFGIIF